MAGLRLAVVLAVLAIFGLTVTSVSYAGGGGGCTPEASTPAIRLEVIPSIQSAEVWPDTQRFVKSAKCVGLILGTWFRYVPGSSVALPVGPSGYLAGLSGDPAHFMYATGVYIAFPEGTLNSFASAKWYSTTEGCDAPKVVISVTNPRSPSAAASGIIDNRDGSRDLFVQRPNGGFANLPVGLIHQVPQRQQAEVVVSTRPSTDPAYRCAILEWNVSSQWTG